MDLFFEGLFNNQGAMKQSNSKVEGERRKDKRQRAPREQEEKEVLLLRSRLAGGAESLEELLVVSSKGSSAGTSLELGLEALALTTLEGGGDETLDLGDLGDGGLSGALDLTGNDVLADVVLLGKVEELSDLRGTSGGEGTGDEDVGDSLDGGLSTGLDDDVDDRDVRADDATTDGLSLAASVALRSVETLVLAEEEEFTLGKEDSLLHGETVLIVTSLDLEGVVGVLVTEDLSRNLVGDVLVIEDARTSLVLNLESLLTTSGGIGNVDLKLLSFFVAQNKTKKKHKNNPS